MSWYRTYRPQTVASLHIAPVRESFQKILDTGLFSHAYLLCGPKGTGKTSGARILAKVLNCEKNRKVIEQFLQKTGETSKLSKGLSEPCNLCSSCLAITNGNSLSVVEMDAASNRGIDDIRSLREGIGLVPADGVISVYIIDEVHMLTTEAFNALLKVLEEPPAHVVFILATTDPQKMPVTVISRCTLVQYRKASLEELQTRLKDIATEEKIAIADEFLTMICSTSDGSFRDAVKLFEQIANGKSKITEEDVSAVIGSLSTTRVSMLLNALMKKSVEDILVVFSSLESEGIDGNAFQKEVLKVAHTKMLEFAKDGDKRMHVLVKVLQAISVPPEPLSPVSWLPFELACLEWCLAGSSSEVQSVGTPKSSPEKQKPSSVKIHEFVPVPKMQTKPIEEEPLPAPKIELGPAQFELTGITSKWIDILKAVKQKSSPVEGLLRSTRPVDVQGNTLVCEANYKFHKEQLEIERNRIVIETVLQDFTGGKVLVSFILGGKATVASTLPDSNVSGAVADDSLVKAATEAFL